MNYFTVKQVYELGNGFVVLILSHEHGEGPDVNLPVAAAISDYDIGDRVEVEVTVVSHAAPAPEPRQIVRWVTPAPEPQ